MGDASFDTKTCSNNSTDFYFKKGNMYIIRPCVISDTGEFNLHVG